MVRNGDVSKYTAPSGSNGRLDARTYRQLLGGRPPKEVKKTDTAPKQMSDDYGKKPEPSLKISEQPSSNQHLDGVIAMGIEEGVVNLDVRKDGKGISNEPLPIHGSPGEQLEHCNKSVQRTSSLKMNEYWVPVRLSDLQLEQYCATLLKNSLLLCSSLRSEIVDDLHNTILAILKCGDHPYLVDNALQRRATSDSLNTGIEASGKLQLLDKFLQEIKERGLKVLILYQSFGNRGKNSLTIGHILDDFICQRFGRESYAHIYGRQMEPSKRQEALNLFNGKKNDQFVMLVENSPYHQSIKIFSLDIVIFFNSEFDPHNDRKSLLKMTLHSRFSQLMVFRLYTSCTLEEKILNQAKIGMTVENNISNLSHSVSHMLLFWGAPELFKCLDHYHGCSGAVSDSNNPKEQAFLPDVLHELSRLLSCLIDGGSIECLILAKAEAGDEGYTTTIPLYGESKVQTLDNIPPHVLWDSLLTGRCPQWKLLPGQPQHVRRRFQLSDSEPQQDEDARQTTTRKYRTRLNIADEHVGRKRVGDTEKLVARKKPPKLTGICRTLSGDGVRLSSSPKKTIDHSDCSDDCSDTCDATEANLREEKAGLAEGRDYHGEAEVIVGHAIRRRMTEVLLNQQREIKSLLRTKRNEQEQLEKERQLEADHICREHSEEAARQDALTNLDQNLKEKHEKIKRQTELLRKDLEVAHFAERVKEKQCTESREALMDKAAYVTDPHGVHSSLAPVIERHQSVDIQQGKVVEDVPCIAREDSTNFLPKVKNITNVESDCLHLNEPTHSASSPDAHNLSADVCSQSMGDHEMHDLLEQNQPGEKQNASNRVLEGDISSNTAFPEQPTATLSPLCPDIPQTGAAMPHCQNDGFCESAVEVQASSQPALANLAVSSGQSIMRLADPLPLSAEGDMHNFGLQLAVPDGHGPLEMEMIRIQEELKKAKEDFDENVMHLNAARQKEMEELNKKYSLLIRDTMDAFEQKKGELNTNYETIGANKHLALAAYSLMPEDDSFSSMHQHLLPSTHSPAMIPSAAFSQTSLGMTTSASTGRPLVRAVSRLSDLISTDLISSHHGPAHLRSIANPPSTRTARAPPPHLQPFRAPQGMPVTANSWPPELLISLRQANGARGLQNAYNPSI